MISRRGCVGVIGATSIVGEYLLPLLVKEGWEVVAFSRREQNIKPLVNGAPTWQLLSESGFIHSSEIRQKEKKISFWICLAPIWVLPEYFPLLLSYGARRVVAISSTSRFTKKASADDREKKIAKRLADSEETLMAWAKKENIACTVLRPTMVYDFGRDKNITFIARFIKRFRFFCILGEASGLRQPVHAQDVASACAAALKSEAAINRSYNISGGEVLNYREMVGRIFEALNKKQRYVKIPLWLFCAAVFFLQLSPRYRHWSAAMAQRMNQDMAFDNMDARRDLGFSPGPFHLVGYDLKSE